MEKTTQFSSLEDQIAPLILKRGYKLATAESCTGGLIASMITRTPGSSKYFVGGIVSYSNEAKMKLLGVRSGTLENFGAVSEKTAYEMARGVCEILDAEIGVSVTGIAGPGGGTLEKPLGLTWIGLHTPQRTTVKKFIWKHDRIGNQKASAEAALQLVIDTLRS